MQELVKEGRKGMQETEVTLGRTEKLVEDTLQIGQQVGSRAQAHPCLWLAHGGLHGWGLARAFL